MESSRNLLLRGYLYVGIIKGGQNGVKSQLICLSSISCRYYKGGAKWSQVATAYRRWLPLDSL